MREWIVNYIEAEKAALDSIPVEQVESVILKFKEAHAEGRQIFMFGNGGSALNDNVSWMTAIGNDYSYEDIYLRQLENYAQAGDIVLTMSVSGSSPNLVKAFEWANDNGLHTIALVGGKRGKLADLASETIVIDDTHYGRAEDCQMGIAHMLCYAFMEVEELKS